MAEGNSNKVIGIISYLPDDERTRAVRKSRLTTLVAKCRKLFPSCQIIAIAQNWKGFSLDGVVAYEYDSPLGILGARRELRKRFLESKYEYLIMLDDDCDIRGNSGDAYLKQIDANPRCFYEYRGTLLKLFCIHRDVFDGFPEVDPQKGQGYEDRAFVGLLRRKHPDRRVVLRDTGLEELGNSTNDAYSTWVRTESPVEMLERTERWLDEITI